MSQSEENVTEIGFDDIFAQFQTSLRAELQKQEERNRVLQTTLDQYRQENLALKAKLEPPREDFILQVKDDTDALEHKVETTHDSVDNLIAYSTYGMLQDQYQETWQNLKNMTAAYEHYKQKYRNAKNMIRPWQEYARRCESKWKEREKALPATFLDTNDPPRPTRGVSHLSTSRPSTPDSTTTLRQPRSGGPDVASTLRQNLRGEHQDKPPSKLSVVVLSRTNSPETSPLYLRGDEGNSPVLVTQKSIVDTTANAPASSQTEDSFTPTRAGQDQNQINMTYPASDVQQEQEGPTFMRPEDAGGSVADAIHIKSEPKSSPHPSVEQPFLRTETMDLDDAGEHIITPRRQQRTKTFRSMNSPRLGAKHHEVLNESISVLCDKAELQGASRSTSTSPGLAQARDSERTIQLAPALVDKSNALHTIDSKRHDLLRDELRSSKISAKRRGDVYGSDVASVAEDGDTSLGRFKVESPPSRHRANILIGDLLEHGTPLHRAIITPATARSFDSRPHSSIDTPSIRRNDTSEAYRRPLQPLPTPMTGASKRFPGERLDLAEESLQPKKRFRLDQSADRRSSVLRTSPLEMLKPEDFKLNPRAHGDINLDIIEPIRNREDRRHMHGCTDPDCHQCGKTLHALAEEMPISVGSSLFASTQERSMTDEERLLYHHLGSSFSQDRIARMTPQKRTELILEAKRQILAERYGRHKLRPGARAKSPPGFWDVDMPTTQDMEARAEEVERRRMEIVKERRREAMRPGGKWMFRDE